MEDTQDIRGKNVAKATQLSKPVSEDGSLTNNQPSCNAIHESEDQEDLSKMVKL